MDHHAVQFLPGYKSYQSSCPDGKKCEQEFFIQRASSGALEGVSAGALEGVPAGALEGVPEGTLEV